MLLLLGALTIGLILSLLAFGAFISFRLFSFPDITAEGSITLGAAVVAVLLVAGVHPMLATGAAFAAGMVAGMVTGILHTRFHINRVLSGIIVMTALFSVNLRIMDRANVPLMNNRTLATMAENVGSTVFGDGIVILGWEVGTLDLSMLILSLLAAACGALLLYLFLKTQLGTALQASGDNPAMMRALGVNVNGMVILGLALANGLTALAGALLTQYQGFADVQMGIGMMVWGLASIIIGEALIGSRSIGMMLVGAILGSVLFRLLVAIALRGGLDPNDLKLVTAVFVLVALILPKLLPGRRGQAASA